jgi:hypothetical protein
LTILVTLGFLNSFAKNNKQHIKTTNPSNIPVFGLKCVKESNLKSKINNMEYMKTKKNSFLTLDKKIEFE